MRGRLTLILIGLLTFASSGAAAVNFLTRALERTTAQTNAAMIVIVHFTNATPNTVHGFYYADQLPSGLNVTTLGVSRDGQAITNYTVETGLDGDVYPGCTPYRWLLERPENDAVTNAIQPQATVQIIFALSATNSGTFPLQPAAWIGFDRQLTNALFGFDTSGTPPAVSFLVALAPSPTRIHLTNNLVVLSFATEANVTYHVEAKHDLNATNWVTLTNLVGTGTPLTFAEPVSPGTNRFYRVRLP